MIRIRFLSFILLTFFSTHLLAWSAQGHRVMAQIAEEHLTPAAKQQVDALLQVPIRGYPMYGRTLVTASTWADQIRQTRRVSMSKKFSAWHFIDIPFSDDPSLALPKLRSENLLQALKQNKQILRNPDVSLPEKAFSLRFFIHLVADAHQPLHCVTRVTGALPKGDHGGNNFSINMPGAENLHQLWDSGLGLFQTRRDLAHEIQRKYPFWKYKNVIKDNNPASWIKECHEIARTIAYNIKEGSAPSAVYLQKGQQVVEKQVAIAGYRLAYQLNNLFR